MTMTNDEIRIKVAEACGLKFVPAGRIELPNSHEIWPDHWEDTRGQRKRIDGSIVGIRVTLPNYPEDLNACAEFESELKKLGVFSSYLSNLALTCGFNAQGDEAWFKLHTGLDAVCSATARQRCLAYLKVKGILP